MNPIPLALLGPWEILLIFVIFSVFVGAAVGVLAWVIHEIRKSGVSRPPHGGSGPTGGGVGAPGTVDSALPRPPAARSATVTAGSVSLAACPRCGGAPAEGAASGLCAKCLFEVGLGTQPPMGAGGPAWAPPDPETLAREFPQFEVFERIGQGGMGAVYRARQRALDRMVALKVLPRDPGRDPAFTERFHREARTLARLSHPNIVGVHEFGESGDHLFLAMELVEGADLRRVLQQGRLSPAEALRIVPVLCDALQYAHSQGVVHRDIKPGNILLDREGRVKIVDFGIAKWAGIPTVDAGVPLTQTRQTVGTPHYMAPEQVENPQAVDHRADIYSLGVVFYEMLTGELPLGRFAPPSRRVQVDVRLDDVVLRALEKEPERRYQQAGEVGTEVQRIAAADAMKEAPAPASSPAADAGSESPSAKGAEPSPNALPTSEAKRVRWTRLIAALGMTLLVPVAMLAWNGVVRGGGFGGTPVLPVLWILGVAGLMAPAVATGLGILTLRDVIRTGGSRRLLKVSFATAAFFPSLLVVVLVFYLGLALTLGVLRVRMNEVILAFLVGGALLAGGGLVVGYRRWLLSRLERARMARSHRGVLGTGLLWGLPCTVLAFELVLGLVLSAAYSKDISRQATASSPAISWSSRHLRVNPDTGALEWESSLVWRESRPALAGWIDPAVLPDLDPERRRAIDEALGRAWNEYASVLRRHRTWTTNDAGRVRLEIRGFPQELDRIENAFWTVADAELGREGQRGLRTLLGGTLRGPWRRDVLGAGRVPLLGQAPSMPHPPGLPGDPIPAFSAKPEPPLGQALFWAGEEDVTLEYWRVGTWHRWRLEVLGKPFRFGVFYGNVRVEGPHAWDSTETQAKAGSEEYDEAAELPDELRRLIEIARGE